MRQPLAKVLVKVRSEDEKQALRRVESQILEELNVKALEPIDQVFACDQPGYVGTSEGDYQVVVVSQLSPELRAEGTAREVVRRVQTMRRQAGFDVTDHITVRYQADACFAGVMAGFAGYIQHETLSKELAQGPPDDSDYKQTHVIDGQEVILGIKRLPR